MTRLFKIIRLASACYVECCECGLRHYADDAETAVAWKSAHRCEAAA